VCIATIFSFMGIILLMNETLCCHGCGLMIEDDASASRLHCPRCETCVRKKVGSIENDLGYALAGLILFFPAMTLPIISFKLADTTLVNTMFTALPYFYKDGYLILSILVFFTSVFAPLIQIIISILLFAPLYEGKRPRFIKPYFKTLHFLNEWVMLDVYVIAVLVSVVKLSDTSEVIFGSGLVMFILLTSFSFLLSQSFSPSKIWKAYYAAN